MKFFSKINSRLWITYVILVAFVLFIAFAGIVIAFRNSPLLYWQEFVKLNYVTNSLANRLDFFLEANWTSIIDLFLKEADMQGIRVLIVKSNGSIRMDSTRSEMADIPDITAPAAVYQRTEGRIHLFRDEESSIWFYQINPINDQYYLVSAVPRPDIHIRTLFQDELLRPLFQAGVIALGIAFILSWFVARWITRPLYKITQSARQLATGDFPPIKMEGPAEVQHLASVINTMDKQVRNSIQSQKDFVANVSHEFKTPLTSIQGFAQAILDEAVKTKKDRSHAAKVILEETDRLNYLVNDLLTLAKMDAGTMQFQMDKIPIAPILRNVMEKFELLVEEKNISLDFNISDQTQIIGDGERLVQVFSNIVDNAIKFTDSGGKISVFESVEHQFVTIHIQDTGMGIGKQDIEKVFERFYQVDKSRGRTESRSVGLGLPIANQIIRAHKGEIAVESSPGKGSCFMVKLPLAYAKTK